MQEIVQRFWSVKLINCIFTIAILLPTSDTIFLFNCNAPCLAVHTCSYFLEIVANFSLQHYSDEANKRGACRSSCNE